MADVFDESRLDDPDLLEAADAPLRHLADSGARIRREVSGAGEALLRVESEAPPRAVVAVGEDARLLRVVLEPLCPVPFVAWPAPGLPGWAGTLDLVVVLGPGGGSDVTASSVDDAIRRGCALVTACPEHSVLAEHARGRHSIVLPTQTGDSLAAAVVMLLALHRLGVGCSVDAEEVARALDEVAVACSPRLDIATNPAKDVAIAFADLTPLVWGGSVFAARAARRVAEAFRRTTGRPALAAEAVHLLAVIDGVAPRDLFADPFDPELTPSRRPGLLILDDGSQVPVVREERGRLAARSTARDVRLCSFGARAGSDITRYAALANYGSYAAHYLALGLGRGSAADSGEW